MRTFEIREKATGRVITAVRAEDETHALEIAAAEAGYGSFVEMARSLEDDAASYVIHNGEEIVDDEERSGAHLHKRLGCPPRPLYR